MKQFSQYILTILVIFSLFAPAVIPFIEDDRVDLIVLNPIEEENKQENKLKNLKDLEEKQVFFERSNGIESAFLSLQQNLDLHYLEDISEFHSQINYPPPEHRS
jgi:hypothetical protein